jgi:cyclase
MRATKLTIVGVVLMFVLAPTPILSNGSGAPKPEDHFTLVKLADGVFAAIAKSGGLASGNAGFISGDEGTLVFDTFFTPAAALDLLTVAQSESGQHIKYAVNSHYHLDHTGGNQLFTAARIPIIGHDRLIEWQTTKNRRFLPSSDELHKRLADRFAQLNQTPPEQLDKRAEIQRQIRRLDAMIHITLTNPTVTFGSGSIRLYLGKREVGWFTLTGHTGGDVLAYVPDANVVFTGDMAWRKTLPNLVDATVSDWIPSLDKLLSDYPTAKFVPGHGEVANVGDVKEFRDYLDDLRTRVKQAIADGLTVDQAKERLKLPEKYKSFGFQNFATPNVEDMYKELTGKKKIE